MVKTRQPLWTFLICSILAAHAVFAQSTLTQIRDTVANADGTPFNGTVVITWNGSTGSNSGSSSPLSTSARIYSGVLSVLLVPTTTASAGTFYQVLYYGTSGTVSWTETWQVPPSMTPLTLNAIRTSSTQGSIGSGNGGGSGSGGTTNSGGSSYATLPIAINQVTSLSADLASINSAVAALGAQIYSLSTLGSAATTSAAFIDGEEPVGNVDGLNAAFNLSQSPVPAGSLAVFRNGLLQSLGVDYTLSGPTLTFLSGSIPRPNDVIAAFYRVAGAAPVSSFTDYEIPGGTIDGNNLSFTLAVAPNPPLSLKLYKNGVLLNLNIDFTLSGKNISFTNITVTPQPGDSLIASYRHF